MLEDFIVHYAVWDRDPDSSPHRVYSMRFVAPDKDCARTDAKRYLKAIVAFHVPEHLRPRYDELEPEKDIEITVTPWAAYGNKLDAMCDRLRRDMRLLNNEKDDDDDTDE